MQGETCGIAWKNGPKHVHWRAGYIKPNRTKNKAHRVSKKKIVKSYKAYAF